jgi:hypothetical protein
VHLDWTEWPELNGSRYGVVTTLYYTRAWFDRYLKGNPQATDRLVADVFDDSADVHSISSGRFDPATGQNVPPTIAGQPVVDRLSFNFRSGYWLEGGTLACESMRDGCARARARRRRSPRPGRCGSGTGRRATPARAAEPCPSVRRT